MLATSLLAKIGHPSHHKHKVLAVLKAYFDESGTDDKSTAVMVSGLVAPIQVWDKFDPAWNEQLDVPKLPYFHAVDCEHGNGIFQPLSGGIRDSLVWGLADVIGKHKPLSVNAGITLADWNSKRFPSIVKAFRTPYHACFSHCIDQLITWADQNDFLESFALVFDDQREYKAYAEEIYDAYKAEKKSTNRLVSLQFADDKSFPGLQAIDLVLYEQHWHFEAGITDPDKVTRVGMRRLLAGDLQRISTRFDGEFWGRLKLFSKE